VKYKLVITFFAVIAMSSGSAFANGDATAGKAKSAFCAGCHGETGVSVGDMFPNLAGQRYGYIVKQLNAFRAGTRPDPLMNPIAGPLSDKDIENLAAYFSQQAASTPASK
jgi:cytochrome c553